MAKASKGVSEIDRLIELASDEPGRPRVAEDLPANPKMSSNLSLSIEDQKDARPSMWRVLLQLRVLLPYLSRLLPLVERGLLGTGGTHSAADIDTSRFDNGIADVQASHRDVSLQLKNQTSEIKYLQEQLTWLSTSLEKETQRQEQIAETLASIKKLVILWGILVVAALLGLTGAVVYLILSRPV
jgi:hypothetical protein